MNWLKGLVFEAAGNFDSATELYKEIQKADETNSLVRKRLVAVLRAQNHIPEAIKELNHYLQSYMSDFEAWMEMCDLYLHELDYTKAAFCVEEMLLINPYNHLLHQKYGEIKYTMGGQENMEHAKKYFAHALKLNPNNMRALYGFFLSASHLAQRGTNSKAKKDNAEYAETAWKQIMSKYEEKNPTMVAEQQPQYLAITGMMTTMQISPNHWICQFVATGSSGKDFRDDTICS